MATLLYVDDEVLIGKAVARGFELMGWIEEMHPPLASRVTFVTGELADSTNVSRIWPTLGRPVLQKAFDFADLERSIEDAERSDGT